MEPVVGSNAIWWLSTDRRTESAGPDPALFFHFAELSQNNHSTRNVALDSVASVPEYAFRLFPRSSTCIQLIVH